MTVRKSHHDERRFPLFWPLTPQELRSADVFVRWARQSEWHGLSASHRSMILRRNLHRLHQQVSDVLFAYHQPPSNGVVFLLALHDGAYCMLVAKVHDDHPSANRFSAIFGKRLEDVVRFSIDDDDTAYIRGVLAASFVTDLPQDPRRAAAGPTALSRCDKRRVRGPGGTAPSTGRSAGSPSPR